MNLEAVLLLSRFLNYRMVLVAGVCCGDEDVTFPAVMLWASPLL